MKPPTNRYEAEHYLRRLDDYLDEADNKIFEKRKQLAHCKDIAEGRATEDPGPGLDPFKVRRGVPNLPAELKDEVFQGSALEQANAIVSELMYLDSKRQELGERVKGEVSAQEVISLLEREIELREKYLLPLREYRGGLFDRYCKSEQDPAEAQELSEIEIIARSLPGKRGAIFRFLARKKYGVTFQEFEDARDPDTGDDLTNSCNRASIAAMMRNLSRDLERYGWSISAPVAQNLIKAEKLGEENK